MLKKMPVFALFLGIVSPLSAGAQDSLAKFKGGIGVIPVSSGVGDTVPANPNQNANVNRNVVRGVQPAGQIWVIADLRADVKADGLGGITVKGKGLILGGGNSAGRTTGQNVLATLICEAAAPFTERSTDAAGVPLALNGDFRIDDVLSPAPVDCPSPMLLIRNAVGRVWFAVGIPNFGDDD